MAAGIVSIMPSASNRISLLDDGRALVNPDMGWTFHYYSNTLEDYGSKLIPSDTLDDFPGLSTIYLRIPWTFIEMEEGQYNWEVIDTPAQRWIDSGLRVAFRITALESWMQYATPEWVRKAGAKGTETKRGKGSVIWRPDFGDPVFLQKVENFVASMAKRYDGSERVDFVDVGSLGMWGEGHSAGESEYCSLLEGQKKHIDIYCRHFKKTLIAISDDFAGNTDIEKQHFPITDYALSKGVTLRDDSIMVLPPPEAWFSTGIAQLFWPTRPVIIETEHYGSSKRRNAFSKEQLLQSVEDYHASYMSIHYWPHEFLQEMKEGIDNVNRRLGYRLQLQECRWPNEVTMDEPFKISMALANAGVSPCYRGGFPCFTLKDEKGGIVSVLVDAKTNVKHLQPGSPGQPPTLKLDSVFVIAPTYKVGSETFYRSARAGGYNLYFSIGALDGTPVFNLPYKDGDGHKRYKIGEIRLAERVAAPGKKY